MKLSASLRIQAYFLSSTAKASNTTLKYLETKTKVLVHFSKTFAWTFVKYRRLETAASEKLLGLTVNSDLNWTTHVDKLSTTLKQRLGLLRRIKYKVNCHKLQIIAEAIFQSKIRYGISVYTIPKFEFHNLEQAMDPNIAKLQVIQNDMMRLLKGKDRKSHTNMEKLRQELKMM